jgi:hypothetical protein
MNGVELMNSVEHIFAFILMSPLSAIVLHFGGENVKAWLKSRERQMELRLKMIQEQNKKAGKGDGNALTEIAALRAELAALRDTSTQYDISLEHTMQRIEHTVQHVEQRVGRLETKSATTKAAVLEKERQQIGIR